MSNNSDPLFERYADLDFAEAKSVAEVPALARLQAERGGQAQETARNLLALGVLSDGQIAQARGLRVAQAEALRSASGS